MGGLGDVGASPAWATLVFSRPFYELCEDGESEHADEREDEGEADWSD